MPKRRPLETPRDAQMLQDHVEDRAAKLPPVV